MRLANIFFVFTAILILSCGKIHHPSKPAAKQYDIVVAKDGSGDYRTVQEAINAVPDDRTKQTVIYIKNGVYKEKVTLPASKKMVKLVGQDVDSVVLTYDDYASKKNSEDREIGTSGSSSFFVYGDDFTAENITFENSSGPVGQAVAIRISSDRVRFINCRFLGFQDTLYTQGSGSRSRQFYVNCYIEGTTDFIFGAATAVFKNCMIYCKKGGQYITAANTPKEAPFGYVFINCKITGNEGTSYYLGRPWGDFAKTVFIRSELPVFIRAEGWHNWGRPAAEKTVFYAEYKNYGAGASTSQRVPWSHQLTDEQAKQYTLNNIFNGWDVTK